MTLEDRPADKLRIHLGIIATVLCLLVLLLAVPLISKGQSRMPEPQPSLILPGFAPSQPGPELEITKELTDPSTGIALVGETITFVIHVTNIGDTEITSLTITDTYEPDYLAPTFSSVVTDVQDPTAGTMSWFSNLELPLLPTEEFTIAVTFSALAPISTTFNQVTAQGEDENQDPVAPEPGSAAVAIHERLYVPLVLKGYPPAPDLSTSIKSADKESVEAGDVLTYTIVLTNSGKAAAEVALFDPIPPQTAFLPDSEAGCTYTETLDRIEWDGTLPAGSAPHECTFSVQVETTASGTITNSAAVDDGFHSSPTNLEATVPVVDWYQGSGTQALTVYSLAVCPNDPNIIYAGTKEHGVYKSPDGGISWHATTLTDEMIWSVVVHPEDCDVAFATTWGQGVIRIAPGTSSPMNDGLGELYLYVLAIDPNNTIYAGTYSQGIYAKALAEDTWTFAGLGGMSVDALVIDSTTLRAQTIYAGTWGNGVYKSTDGSGSWTEINGGLPDLSIYALALDPTDPQVVYAGTYTNGVYRSDDQGGAWAQDGLSGQVAYTVVVDPDGTVYAGTDGTMDGDSIYKRPDNSQWAPLVKQPGAPIVRNLAFSDATLLAGTTAGVWRYGPE